MRKLFFFIATMCCAVTINATEGALSGEFSVAANKKVVFAKGNLQATTTNLGAHWAWAFAANQWDMIGNATANNVINGSASVSANGTVDLFGWSTDATYYGIHNSTTNSTYSGDFVDWGSIIGEGWRTLSDNEWDYLFSYRTNANGLRGPATVNGIHGYILLPDSWVAPTGLSFQGNTNVWTTNQYTVSQWADMQTAGAVFLPAAGYRGVSVENESSNGLYWSSTQYSATKASYVYFGEDEAGVGNDFRCFGHSVRLVQDVEVHTAIYDVKSQESNVESQKVLHDGQLLIVRNGKTYTMQGAEVR